MTTKLIRAVVLLLATASIVHAQTPFGNYFPMEKGTRWTYSGKVEWTYDTNKIGSGQKTITMVVEDSFQNDDVRVAVLSGGPWNFVWWEPNRPNDNWAIIEQRGTYYLIPKPSEELLSDLRAGRWPADANIEASIWFQAPLKAQAEFCDPEDDWRIAKHETDYCWYVTDEGKAPLPRIGVSTPRQWFNLRYQTMPDHEIDTIVPGIGITHFVYVHHGTTSNVDVKLVAFHRGTKRGVAVKAKSPLPSR